jgi:MFS transporter, DHA2 family, multidrug resistance protein
MKRWAQDGLGWLPVLCIVAGVAVGVLFVRRQRRLPDPLIDLRLFQVPAFRVSLGTFMLTTLVVFGSYVYIAQYLQLVLGLSPLAAGLWLLPGSCGVIIGSTLAPAIVRRVRPGFVMGGGLALAAIGFAILTRVGTLGLAGLVTGSAILYLGLGPVFTLGTDLIVGAAPPERAGAAAAISETSSELGGALGIAILGSIGTAIYRGAMARAALDGITPETLQLARDTLGAAAAAAARLSDEGGARLMEAARAAFARSLEVTAAICAVVAAATAVMAVVMLGRIGRTAGPEPQPAPAASPPPPRRTFTTTERAVVNA